MQFEFFSGNTRSLTLFPPQPACPILSAKNAERMGPAKVARSGDPVARAGENARSLTGVRDDDRNYSQNRTTHRFASAYLGG